MEELLPLLNSENTKIVSQDHPTSWIKLFVKWVCYLIHYCYIGVGLYVTVGGTFLLIQKYGSTWYLHIFDKFPFPGSGEWLPYPNVILYFLILPLCIIPIFMLKMNSKSLIFRLCTKFFYVALLPDCYFAYFIYQNGPDPTTPTQKYFVYFLVFHPFPLCILPLLELEINNLPYSCEF